MRSAILFLTAILAPCVVLAWVSWDSMRKEANDIKTQRTAFYQQSADSAARAAAEFMTGELRGFGETVDRLLATESVEELRPRFHQSIRGVFPLAAAGLVLDTESGHILPQTEPSEQALTAFVTAHAWFFGAGARPMFVEIPLSEAPSVRRKARLSTSREKSSESLYGSINDALNELAADAASSSAPPAAAKPAREPAPLPAPAAAAGIVLVPEAPAGPDGAVRSTDPGATPAAGEKSLDDVRLRTPSFESASKAPPSPPAESASLSLLKPVTTTLRTLVARHETGIAGEPRDDGLFTLFWYRPPDVPEITFAIALEPEALRSAVAKHSSMTSPDEDTRLALLNHMGQPAAEWVDGTFDPASSGGVIATREIGAALPRWEAAVFLRDPSVFDNLAAAARWRLGIIVTTASLAAIAGAFFILRDARRAARDARLKTDFVSNVSHELKTPLTSIRMFSDLLGNNPAPPPEKTKRYAEVIADEAARLTRLINNVLTFSRMEGGKNELQTAPLDLRALVSETVEHMRLPLEKDGFTLEVALPGDPITVRGDGDALSQVLFNLLSNAGKYGAAPDRPRHITVSLRAENGSACVSVADRGNGVPRGHEGRIFEKFQRAHDTLASGTAGNGLGLTIARRLVEAHGGTLEYAPREGGGAVFTIELPNDYANG